MQNRKTFLIIILACLGYLFFRGAEEFWLRIRSVLSLKWEVAFLIVIIGSIFVILFAMFILFWPNRLAQRISKVLNLRNRLGVGRWALFLFSILGVIVFFQYSKYGNVFAGPSIRYCFCVLLIGFGGFLLSKAKEVIAFSPLILAALVVVFLMTVAVDFVGVTDYPFSLGWSEGNRMWDYSVLFGKRFYDYPQDQKIFAHIDIGRQLIGGIPYLFNGVSIWAARFWNGLMGTLLYGILGWTLFRRTGERGKLLFLSGLWVYLFINQGPIHPPLVVCAILVSLAWRRSYWVAVPLLVLSGYFAQLSRFTWMFAPAMWILLLEFSERSISPKPGKTWARSVVLPFAGLTGGVILPTVLSFIASFGSGSLSVLVSDSSVVGGAMDQGLLWYRLLPSATFDKGVLPGLLQAILPVLMVLVYLMVTRRLHLHSWQKIVIGGILTAFLVVGLVVSTKIGGGGDLHNLDMLLIGILFFGVTAWQNGGRELFTEAERTNLLIQVVLLVLVVLPGLRYLRGIEPLKRRPKAEEVEIALDLIREQIEIVKEDGQVLFMDQRQLLTFGFVQVPLNVEYEKKYLMDQALSKNAPYFNQYYEVLADGYYDLIITEPLLTDLKGREFVFGEENDAWVTWVSDPTLCFYEKLEAPKFLSDSIGVVLLVPKADTSACSVFLQPANPE